MKKKWIYLITIISIFIFLGYIRDFIFVNINFQLTHLNKNTEYSYLHSFFYNFGIQNLTMNQLFSLKWGLTFLWVFLNASLSFAATKIYYPTQKIIGIIVLSIFATCCFLASIIFSIGYFSGSNGNYYPIVRALIGAAQSPIPLLIILPAIKLNKSFNK